LVRYVGAVDGDLAEKRQRRATLRVNTGEAEQRIGDRRQPVHREAHL
jgi:hypothetical protein